MITRDDRARFYAACRAQVPADWQIRMTSTSVYMSVAATKRESMVVTTCYLSEVSWVDFDWLAASLAREVKLRDGYRRETVLFRAHLKGFSSALRSLSRQASRF